MIRVGVLLFTFYVTLRIVGMWFMATLHRMTPATVSPAVAPSASEIAFAVVLLGLMLTLAWRENR